MSGAPATDQSGFREVTVSDGVSISEDRSGGLLALRFHRRDVIVLVSKQDVSDLDRAIHSSRSGGRPGAMLNRPPWEAATTPAVLRVAGEQ